MSPYWRYLMSATVTAKGQITIPKRVRDTLGLVPGSKVDFDINERGEVVLLNDGRDYRRRLERLRGIAGPGLTTDELMALTRDNP